MASRRYVSVSFAGMALRRVDAGATTYLTAPRSPKRYGVALQ